VADRQDAELAGAHAAAQHVPNLRLCHRVEHRADLVGDQVAGAGQQRARHSDALQFAAGQFVWIAAQPRGADRQRVHQAVLGCPRLVEDLGEPPARVDGGLRMLEPQLHRARPGPS
jgi:hypothetical protein